MESNLKKQLKVGAFLAAGIVVVVFSIFSLGADKALFKSFIHLHAHFDQVQGLAEGSVVSLSGVNVGNVQTITFLSDKNSLDVDMKIDKQFLPRIREGSQVEIRTQGALGDKFVFILPGKPENPAVKDGDMLDLASSTDLLGILSDRASDTSKIFDIINEVYKITKTLNDENRIGHIINNLELASSRLNDSSREADKFVTAMTGNGSGEKVRASIEHMNSIMSKIDRGEGSLGAIINDPSIHNQLKALLGGNSRGSQMKSLIRTSIEKGE